MTPAYEVRECLNVVCADAQRDTVWEAGMEKGYTLEDG